MAGRQGFVQMRAQFRVELHLRDRRLIRAQLLRKEHRPPDRRHPARLARGPAVEFAVDEIRQPDEQQPERRDDHQAVADARPRQLFPPRPVEREQQHTDDPAVARHPAFPHLQRPPPRIVRVIFPPAVKDQPAQPPADHHAEDRRPGDEIVDLRLRQIRVTAPRQPAVKPRADEEREHIRKPVPAQPHAFAKLEKKRTEIVQVVGRHGAADSETSRREAPPSIQIPPACRGQNFRFPRRRRAFRMPA